MISDLISFLYVFQSF